MKTNDLEQTIDHVLVLLQTYDPDTTVASSKTWANERKIVITSATEDKGKTYEIELALGKNARPLVVAAQIVDDWLRLKPRCEHDWTEWSYAVSPTGRRTCKLCGEMDID